MDILGLFPMEKGQLKFLIVEIDYFTKWIEIEAFAKITVSNMQKFTWKNIVCRCGLPQIIVTDNGKQFIDKKFESFLTQLNISHQVTSIEHFETNVLLK
uniref:Integrase catalytic domain-containing protein n=1 Tax=Cajanus cajan TaxID=3821 RepID=A0A151RY79_CAJCA|nr:hypothetical protein KK1_030849 [Cajanus cajan]